MRDASARVARTAAPGAATGGPVLQVRDLHVRFAGAQPPVHAVRGVSYAVAPGEVLGLVGESGCGKSVSSLAVMGLLPDSAEVTGEVIFDGQSLLGRSDAELSRIRGRDIAMVFQDPQSALTPVYTVGDQVAEAVSAHHRKMPRAAARRRAVELLDLVGIPAAATRAHAFPHEFSGGMRQRVVIAMAIANNPKLIIADEPTTALDVTVQAQVLQVLRTAREVTGAAMILITHDLGVVAGVADRVAVMYAGRIVERAEVHDLFARPAMPYTIGLLRSLPDPSRSVRLRLQPVDGNPPSLAQLPPGCPFAPRCPVALPVCRTSEPELRAVGGAQEPELRDVEGTEETERRPAGGGHEAACVRAEEIAAGTVARRDVFGAAQLRPRRDVDPTAPVVLRVTELRRHYPLRSRGLIARTVGVVRAVDGVSFEIRQGEAFGLVGESGSGKTTTAVEILELRAPASGQIEVLGRRTDTLGGRERRALRRRIQVVFQDPMASLDPRLPVGDIVVEPLRAGGLRAATRRQEAARLLEMVGLDRRDAARYPHEFSGGQRQRVAIARALAAHPQFVVLDEPVSSLDVSIQAGVLNLLDRLRGELNLSYLLVAHDLGVVRHVSDRVGVMYLGKLVEIGPAERVFAAPRHPYSQALVAAAPIPDPVRERARAPAVLRGETPSSTEQLRGCRFRARCPLYLRVSAEKRKRCADEEPRLHVGSDGQGAACHHVGAGGAP